MYDLPQMFANWKKLRRTGDADLKDVWEVNPLNQLQIISTIDEEQISCRFEEHNDWRFCICVCGKIVWSVRLK